MIALALLKLLRDQLVDDLRVALPTAGLHALADEEAGDVLACLEVGDGLFILREDVLHDGEDCALVGDLL